MSIFKNVLSTVFNIDDVLNCFKFPAVNAAVFREVVPCLRDDGSLGVMTICKDESGRRIECPCEDDDEDEEIHEDNVEGLAQKQPGYYDILCVATMIVLEFSRMNFAASHIGQIESEINHIYRELLNYSVNNI